MILMIERLRILKTATLVIVVLLLTLIKAMIVFKFIFLVG